MSADRTPQVFITGVRTGLGWGFARCLLREGARVYGLGRRAPDDLLREFPDRLRFESCDLGRFGEIPPALGSLLEGVTALDLVILNAGQLGIFSDMRDIDMVELRQLMNVNLWANKVLLDELFSPDRTVAEVWGISSGASVNGSRGWNGYSLSKAALNMLIKLYSAELPDTHWIALAPGLVDTRMQEFVAMQAEETVRKFPALDRLRKARGTPDMPGPEEAAAHILAARDRLRAAENGSYVDIRKL